MRTIVNLSGGVCSWAAGKLVAEQSGTDKLTCLFADTLIEDDDLYRFLPETAANIFAIPNPTLPGVRDIPPVDEMPARKAHLASLRVAAMKAIPGLVWIADGRHPFEVYRDERFIGNSRVDPCSKHLKRILLDRWVEANCSRPTTRCVVGLGWWERDRFEGTHPGWSIDFIRRLFDLVKRGDVSAKAALKAVKLGLKARHELEGWTFVAPLIDHKPTMDRHDIYAWLDREGIDPPALSEDGFDTNNCGGFCCKMGHAQTRRLFYKRPKMFAWAAEQERQTQAVIGTSSTVLTRRRGGEKIPLSLVDFAAELDSNEDAGLFSQPACGCFSGEDDEPFIVSTVREPN